MCANVEHRVSRLEEHYDELVKELIKINERLARIETRLDNIEQDIDELKQVVNKRNGYLKFTLVLLGMVLSFVAAMFGLGWRPP